VANTIGRVTPTCTDRVEALVGHPRTARGFEPVVSADLLVALERALRYPKLRKLALGERNR